MSSDPTQAPLKSSFTVEKAQVVGRVVQVTSAVVCVADCIIRFINVRRLRSWATVCLSLYLLVFAAILICTEFNVYRFRTWFYLLNYGWGKALFNMFIALLLFSSGTTVFWFDILAGIYFLVTIPICLGISIKFKTVEKT